MSNYSETFKQQGYVLVKNFIDPSLANYLFEYLRFSSHAIVMAGTNKIAIQGDSQVPGSYEIGRAHV